MGVSNVFLPAGFAVVVVDGHRRGRPASGGANHGTSTRERTSP
jgi:predicted acyl esterase